MGGSPGGGSFGNLAGLLGLGNLNFAQGLNYKTDPLSCTVFVSNVSDKFHHLEPFKSSKQ